METEQKAKNNNQNANIQHVPSTSQEGSKECANGVYICIPSVHSLKPSQHYHKLKNCEKANSNIRLKTASQFRENHIFYNHPNEEPIDLTCTVKRDIGGYSNPIKDAPPMLVNNKITFSSNNIELNPSDIQNIQNDFLMNDIHAAKRRCRKRKYVIKNPQIIQELTVPNLEANDSNNPDFFQIADSRQIEVLKAAKSLFSKRTRTLFHWMYPNAPKAQLKAAVAASWETLGEQEKEFYISQVLGRFGFPQTNLMVNPQLGGLTGMLSLPPLDLTTTNPEGNEETSTAVSSLLLSEHGNTSGGSWMHPGTSANRPAYTQRINRKRGKLGRPPGSKNRKQIKEEFPILKQIRDDPTPDEFQDDPELSKEFKQFRWTLHYNNHYKP